MIYEGDYSIPYPYFTFFNEAAHFARREQ